MTTTNTTSGGAFARSVALGVATLSLALSAGSASAQEDHYKGKTIRLIVGSEAGGGYDAYGRLLAAHLAKHIPGQPQIIVQNMPGVGALVLANYLGNVAANDATVIGGVNPLVATHPIYTPDVAKYDARKLSWIGSMQADTYVSIAWTDAPIKSFKEVLEKEFVVGGSGGSSSEYPPVINALLGAKFKLVLGYKGTAQSMLAMERGEVMGLGGTTWGSLKAQSSGLLKDNKIRVLVQYTKERDPELKDVPTIYEFARSTEERQVMDAVFAYQDIGRAFVMPVGMPAAVVMVMRKAFDDTMADKAFLEEGERRRIDLDPKPGAKIQQIVDDIASTPPAVLARVNEIRGKK